MRSESHHACAGYRELGQGEVGHPGRTQAAIPHRSIPYSTLPYHMQAPPARLTVSTRCGTSTLMSTKT